MPTARKRKIAQPVAATPGMNSQKALLFSWATPPQLDVGRERLALRLDFFGSTILLTSYAAAVATTRVVSPDAIAQAVLRDVPFHSGILPDDALWWSTGSHGPEVALYRVPQRWRAALKTDPGKPARRYYLPMPGLIFVCTPGRPPAVHAVNRRPRLRTEKVYRAPLFNLYSDGQSCPGSHVYPEAAGDIPESFFRAFFAPTGDARGRSGKHPEHLGDLWGEIDGQESYPVDDLIEDGTIADLLDGTRRRRRL